MKVLELSICKLTVIERVNWSWFVFYLLFATYCVFRQLDEAYVSYPYFKLFFINKLFSLKSGCTKKLYWDGKRIINIKAEDLTLAFGFFIAVCMVKASGLCSSVGFHGGEFAILSSQLCNDVFDLFWHVLDIMLFSTVVATLAIGLLKRIKR
jgi:hypothetical protein